MQHNAMTLRTILWLYRRRHLRESRKSNFLPRPLVTFYFWGTLRVKLYSYVSSVRTPRNHFKKIRGMKLPLFPSSNLETCCHVSHASKQNVCTSKSFCKLSTVNLQRKGKAAGLSENSAVSAAMNYTPHISQ
jgi:hypothetical protein